MQDNANAMRERLDAHCNAKMPHGKSASPCSEDYVAQIAELKATIASMQAEKEKAQEAYAQVCTQAKEAGLAAGVEAGALGASAEDVAQAASDACMTVMQQQQCAPSANAQPRCQLLRVAGRAMMLAARTIKQRNVSKLNVYERLQATPRIY